MNRRSQKTIDAIYNAFFGLLKEKEYDRITVKDIVESAYVGRTTFYEYFSTKDVLFDNMIYSGSIGFFENAHIETQKLLCADEKEKIERFFYFLLKKITSDFNFLYETVNSPNAEYYVACFEKHLCHYIIEHFCLRVDEGFRFSIKYVVSAFCEVITWFGHSKDIIDFEQVYRKFKNMAAHVLKKSNSSNERDEQFIVKNAANPIKSQFEEYINVLQILSRTTDDFLYMYDIINREIWFFGDIGEYYPIILDERGVAHIDDFFKIVYHADVQNCRKEISYLEDCITDNHDINFRMVNRKKKIVWLSDRGKVIYDENKKPCVMIGRLSEEALRHLFNPITGLFNKVKLKEDLQKLFPDMDKGYLMFIEVEDLTAINLSYGRKRGEEILKNLSASMEANQYVNRVYHVDSAVFALVLDTPNEEQTTKVYEDIKESTLNNCAVVAGVVPMDNALYIDETGMIDSVKLTLAKAKENSETGLEFFSPEEIKHSIYSVELLDELKTAIDNDFEGFSVQYQPQLLSGNYKLYGAEALMRYNSKRGGPVSPLEFIPVLEQSGLINDVGMWILEQAVITCKKWQKYMPSFHISVNFSTVQFRDYGVFDKILCILEKHGLSGHSLSVEITESIPFSELGRFNTISKQLKNEGIQISIDDFGTGYSNLAYLKDFDIDEIKIDRMFVRGIEEDTYNYNLISNTVEFAKANSIRVCCEGVETLKELTVLESLSADLFQGFLFERPCTPENFEQTYFDKNNIKYKNRLDLIKEIYEYKERKGFVRFNTKDILRDTGVGLWIIRINPANGERELHADETMEAILGAEKKFLPNECYNYWYNRISPDFVEYVSKNLDLMKEKTNGVQLEYKWNHPQLGDVTVRSTGRRGKDSDGMIVLEGYHRIFTDIEEV